MDVYAIIWSPTAKITYYNILEYLEVNWSINELTDFIFRTEDVLNHISANPFLYISSNKNDVRKCVVTRQVSLFYQIRAAEIELLVFWDNRQDPAKMRI